MSRLERIVAACGGVLLDGGARALIPGPNHSHKDRSVSLVETEEGRILIHCFSPKDDWRAVRAALSERGLLDREHYEPPTAAERPIVQPDDEERVSRARRIWSEARELRYTPAAAYLRRRSIELVSPALRFHGRMTSVDDRLRRPALVAAITAADGALCGVQVTLLSRYGVSKAPVATPRRIIGRLIGGAVRLGDPESELAVGEGVETMASASIALGIPAWATLTAHNLSLFEPPACVSRLVVAADSDEAGRAAAAALKDRCAGRVELSVRFPLGGFSDWNDWARRTP